MSKSLGNVIAPEDILKKYGADILRIWVASSNYAEDLRIDHSILDQHADSYRKIRNTFRYLLGNLNDNFEKIDLDKIDITHLPELEQFMLHKIYSLNSNFKNYFNNYDFHNLYKELLNFCTVDLSAFYFDIRKDTLYCDPIGSKKRQSTILLLNVILKPMNEPTEGMEKNVMPLALTHAYAECIPEQSSDPEHRGCWTLCST